MAGSNYLTTYYAKRIMGDSAAASAASALLQTGTGIITNTWIISKTGRSSNYGIRYKYDYDSTRATPEGTADRIEFIGGRTNNNEDVASAWIQLDTGDLYILGNVGIGHDPNTYKLYINGITYSDGDIITHGSFKTDRTGYGLKLIDSDSHEYIGIYDDGTNLWIGATSSTGQHHHGSTYISAGHNGTTGNQSIYISIPANGNNPTTHTSYPLVYKDATGTQYQGIYTDSNGKTAAMTYELKATVNNGTASRIAYYSGANAISSGTIVTDGGYLGSVSYLSINMDHQTTYRLYVDGTSYFTGPITLVNGSSDWTNPVPFIRMTCANNKVFSFAATGNGVNVDIGYDWASGSGAGAAFRSSDWNNGAGADVGAFVLYARKDTTAQYTLTGQTNGVLSWSNDFLVKGKATIGQTTLNSDSYKLYVNGTSYFDDHITSNKSIWFGANSTSGKAILGYNSTYPNYGIWYFDETTDVMTLSASGNADSKTDADFSINTHGAGTLANRNNRIPHTGNTTGTVGGGEQPVYVNAGTITNTTYALKATVNNSTAGYMAYYSAARAVSGTSYAQMIDGCLNLYPANGSYREGIRIHPKSSWSDITLQGDTNSSNTSGIAVNDWFIGNNNGNFYLIRYGSGNSGADAQRSEFKSVSNQWKLRCYVQAHKSGIYRSGLHIYGPTYGNAAADMASGTKGLFSWNDGGPQITFDTNENPGGGQAGALIYTDNDEAATGASWHFVSNQTDWNVTSKRFHARTSISIGTNLPSTSYNLSVTGTGYFSDLLTLSSGSTHKGVKIGNVYVNAINGELLLQNLTALRFGTDDWDYNKWAGLKYDATNKIIYLGIAEGSIFSKNGTALSGGTLALPAIRYLSINGKTAIDANDSWLRINGGAAFSSGIYFGSSLVRTDGTLRAGTGSGSWTDITAGVVVARIDSGESRVEARNGTHRVYLYCNSDGRSGLYGVRTDGTAHSLIAFANNSSTGTFYGNCTGSSGSCTGLAAKATADGDGNTIKSTYLKLSGGTMTGTLKLKASLYAASGGGLDCQNADIIGINSLRFNDTADAFNEGIMFYRDGSAWECLAANSSGFFFRGGTDGTPALNAANANGTLFASVVWGNKVVINSDWVGFYSAAGNTTTRYGFLEVTSTKYYFRKENGADTWPFDFNGNIYTSGRLRVNSTEDVGKNQNGAFIIGNPASTNLAMDDNEIMARNNSAVSTLYINSEGGDVYFTASSAIHMTNGHLYATAVHNAVWNDFAEYRQVSINEPGRVVIPDIDGYAKPSTARLQPGSRIISDTYGCTVGESDTAKTPLGMAGRVLAYPYRARSEYHIGDCVCSAPDGTVDIMTREEIMMYPECIIGIVNEIPTYDEWHQTLTHYDDMRKKNNICDQVVLVKGRIWIDIK